MIRRAHLYVVADAYSRYIEILSCNGLILIC